MCLFSGCNSTSAGGSKKDGLCGSHYSQKQRGKTLIPIGSSRPKPLRPEEIPAQLRFTFDFAAQKIVQPSSSTPSMFITRTCITCKQQKEISVSQVRQSIKKGIFTGKCLFCSPPKGADNHNWKGGRIVQKSGYVRIHSPDHPNSTKEGYVLEHRLVMEKMIGRYLLPFPEETVNHRNGLHDDNRPENLELRIKGTHPPGILPEDAPHCSTCRCNAAQKINKREEACASPE